jgi:hypothetical protein
MHHLVDAQAHELAKDAWKPARDVVIALREERSGLGAALGPLEASCTRLAPMPDILVHHCHLATTDLHRGDPASTHRARSRLGVLAQTLDGLPPDTLQGLLTPRWIDQEPPEALARYANELASFAATIDDQVRRGKAEAERLRARLGAVESQLRDLMG